MNRCQYSYEYLYLIHLFNVPWLYHPLVSNAHLDLTFIFHASCAFLVRMYIFSVHHSFTSSSHSLCGLPFLFSLPFLVCYLPVYRTDVLSHLLSGFPVLTRTYDNNGRCPRQKFLLAYYSSSESEHWIFTVGQEAKHRCLNMQ